MPSLKVRFEGLEEYESALRRAPERVEREVENHISETTRLLARRARDRAHVVTGRMRTSIRPTRKGPWRGSVTVGVPYAPLEVARGGSHDFWTPSVREAETHFRRGMNRLLRRAMER